MAAIRDHATPPSEDIFGALEHRPELLAADPEIAATFCEACIELQKMQAAAAAFETLPADWQPDRKDAIMAHLLFHQGAYAEAAEICRRLVQKELPKRATRNVYFLALRALVRTDLNAAVNLMSGWKRDQRTIRGGEPFRVLGLALAKAGDGRAEGYFKEGLDAAKGDPARILMDYAEYLADCERGPEALALIGGQAMPHRGLLRRRADLLQRLGAGELAAAS
jgi:hypothetical protein